MYRVIKYFTDACDDGYIYNVGDTFPREGLEVSKERLNKLLSANNRQRTPMIIKVEKTVKQEDQTEIETEAETEVKAEVEVEIEKPVKKTHTQAKNTTKKKNYSKKSTSYSGRKNVKNAD